MRGDGVGFQMPFSHRCLAGTRWWRMPVSPVGVSGREGRGRPDRPAGRRSPPGSSRVGVDRIPQAPSDRQLATDRLSGSHGERQVSRVPMGRGRFPGVSFRIAGLGSCRVGTVWAWGSPGTPRRVGVGRPTSTVPPCRAVRCLRGLSVPWLPHPPIAPLFQVASFRFVLTPNGR